MRLLRLEDDGQFSQHEFTGKNIPPYAILSHTWGSDWEEVSFEDIKTGLGRSKAGYNKLRFCATQAASDGLGYFWADTCCIDKASSTELSEAINSMFRWYRDAGKCYAYLADVSVDGAHFESEPLSQVSWIEPFRNSKWFTRGWTLQELLAPELVEFFSSNGQRLGDKQSLSQDILKATGIPAEALQGGYASLSQFSVNERLSWAAGRETKREEDAAYSLLGLFDLAMPLIYGEGREKAFRRLHREREIAMSDIALLKRTASEAFDEDALDIPGAKKPGQLFEPDQESELSEEETLERKIELMQMWWDEAVADHMDPPEEYRKVAVLLIKWTDHLDELGVREEMEDLEAVLRKRFNFYTEVAELDVSSKPQHQLDRHTTAFIENNDGPHTLLIVFYQGHSRYNELYGRLELSACMDPSKSKGISQHAYVNWSRTEDMLRSDDVDGDVLAILDASYASDVFESSKATTQIRSNKRLYELISACSSDQRVRPPGPKSFTRALTNTLTELAKTYGSRPFSTAQINQRIRMLNKKEPPSQLWSLYSSERHIALSPMKGKEADQKNIPWPLAPARSYLKLGLEFRDEHFNKEQIEFLAFNLAKALKDKPIIGLRKIDWLGIEIRPLITLEQTGWAKTAVARWKRVIERKREEKRTFESPHLDVSRDRVSWTHKRPKSISMSGYPLPKIENTKISNFDILDPIDS